MNKNVPYFIVAPGMILLLFFLMLPLISSIWPTLFADQQIALENYIHFFKDSYNLSIFWRTIRISVIVTLVSILLGITTAYFIAGVSKNGAVF